MAQAFDKLLDVLGDIVSVCDSCLPVEDVEHKPHNGWIF